MLTILVVKDLIIITSADVKITRWNLWFPQWKFLLQSLVDWNMSESIDSGGLSNSTSWTQLGEVNRKVGTTFQGLATPDLVMYHVIHWVQSRQRVRSTDIAMLQESLSSDNQLGSSKLQFSWNWLFPDFDSSLFWKSRSSRNQYRSFTCT